MGGADDQVDLVRDVGAAADDLVEAYGRHDVSAYFDHFAEDATFIFHPVDQVLGTRAEYEQLWSTWETEDGFHVQSCHSEEGAIRMLGESAAVFTHNVTTVVSTSGSEETLHERETIVFEHRGGRWLAVHEHLSP